MLCYNCGRGLGEIADVPIFPVTSFNILGTNRFPSQHESDLIKETVANIIPRLMRFEEEVAQVQAVLDKLTVQRHDLRDYWITHKRHLSPILRFLPEIMGEIFLYSLLDDRERINVLIPLAKSVLTPGLVCKSWRQVFLATPNMWSKISILMASPRDINLPMLEVWLKRSSQVPLSIHLNGFGPQSKKALSKLTPHIHRWEELTCGLSDGRLWDELCGSMDRMSAVRTLAFETTHFWMRGTESQMIPSVSMPKLRFHNYSGLAVGFVEKLPWSQISAFEFSKLLIHARLDILTMFVQHRA